MAATRSKKVTAVLRNSYLLVALRLFAGATLFFSAVTKLPLQSRFVEVVQSYHLLPGPLATAYGLALPWVELLIGAYLLLGILLKPSAFATLLIGLSFMIANVTAIVRGELYCGSCFGESIPLSAYQALTLDCFLMLAALLLLLVGSSTQLVSLEGWLARRQQGKIAISAAHEGAEHE